MQILGIDIGGTGIKAEVVDLDHPEATCECFYVPTPLVATPIAILDCIATIVAHFKYAGPIGCGFPGVVRNGVIYKATNLHSSWVGYNFSEALLKATGCVNFIINDADAAGLAEVRLGAAKNFEGSVCMLTIGTGVGSALFYNGALFPNTEFGILPFQGAAAELAISTRARLQGALNWATWAARMHAYLSDLEALLWPERFIIGGGVTQEWNSFYPLLNCTVPIEPAYFGNRAGCLGACLAMRDFLNR